MRRCEWMEAEARVLSNSFLKAAAAAIRCRRTFRALRTRRGIASFFWLIRPFDQVEIEHSFTGNRYFSRHTYFALGANTYCKLERALGRAHTFAAATFWHELHANWIKINRAIKKIWPFHDLDLDLWPDGSQNRIKWSPDNNQSSHQISCDWV